MTTPHDTYLAWLNNAHAFELGLVSALEKQIGDAAALPDMRSKFEEHLEKTRRHATIVAECITRNGGDTSTLKDYASKAMAAVSGLTTSMVGDTLVKNVHSSYAAEHMEIASYTALIAAAETLDDTETSSVLEDVLADEVEMAHWLLEQLPSIVQHQLRS